MKDVLNREVKEGDVVAYVTRSGSTYTQRVCRVVSIREREVHDMQWDIKAKSSIPCTRIKRVVRLRYVPGQRKNSWCPVELPLRTFTAANPEQIVKLEPLTLQPV